MSCQIFRILSFPHVSENDGFFVCCFFYSFLLFIFFSSTLFFFCFMRSDLAWLCPQMCTRIKSSQHLLSVSASNFTRNRPSLVFLAFSHLKVRYEYPQEFNGTQFCVQAAAPANICPVRRTQILRCHPGDDSSCEHNARRESQGDARLRLQKGRHFNKSALIPGNSGGFA